LRELSSTGGKGRDIIGCREGEEGSGEELHGSVVSGGIVE